MKHLNTIKVQKVYSWQKFPTDLEKTLEQLYTLRWRDRPSTWRLLSIMNNSNFELRFSNLTDFGDFASLFLDQSVEESSNPKGDSFDEFSHARDH